MAMPTMVRGQDWKHQVVFPDDPYCASGVGAGDSGWVKFTIKLDDPCTVYFQDSQLYVLHHEFATSVLDPFIGMSASQFYEVTLYETGQLAALGTVIMPPLSGYPAEPDFLEYGIQFIRQDPYTREEIAAMFEVVKVNVLADPNVRAFYFPTYEQTEVAQANLDWFEDQNIPVSSTARWAQGNICYSEGWALGELKFFGADDIDDAYHDGLLEPNDILLTDGVPAEIPFVAGVVSLAPSTPSSHVAILAQTYGVPFVYLAVAQDANQAQQLLGRTIALSAYDDGLGGYDVRMLDVEDELTSSQIAEILELKKPPALEISPIAQCGGYSADTNGLLPEDINCFGGKASNFGILRTAIPDNSPNAVALSFDMWNEFLDQAVTACNSVTIEPNSHLLFWADKDQHQGPTHADFKLDNDGEDVGLYDRDGSTLIDGITFGAQSADVSYGRLPDGSDNWVLFDGNATPGWSNSGGGGPGQGLFINEFMAENDTTIPDPHGSGYPDWIELYNAGGSTVDLGGMYLTDDMNDPTEWMIPVGITGATLREEINNRLSGYTYPPSGMAALSADLAAIRSMFTSPDITIFSQQLQDAVIATLQDPNYGFDPNAKIRFRSSTNVEDSEQFTGAGLYSSYSGCLADELDGDGVGPCVCDPCELNERGVFRAIRKVLASFYNDNAFLERLRHDVNEAEVGMAVLVHHSFPDEIELANGVATLEKIDDGQKAFITLVTQAGAVSVTNPDPSSIPEEVTGGRHPSGAPKPLTFVRASNLVPLGDKVMDWEQDYRDLIALLVAASNRYREITGKAAYVLDLEYKKVAPGGMVLPAGGLVVKQVRPIPQPNDVPSITPFLINQPTEYCIYSGERFFRDGTDVFASHRLKCRWTLETKSVWLDEPNLAAGFYADANIEYYDGNSVQTINEPLPLLPFAYHGFDGTDANDGWRLDWLVNPRSYELWTENIPTLVSQAQNPLFTLHDFGSQPFGLGERRFQLLRLRVDYDDSVRSWAGDDCSPSGLAAATTNELYLWKTPQPSADDTLQQRYYESGGVSITTEFYRASPPRTDDGGTGTWDDSTAPIARWVETVIEGYTTDPVVLTGYYSQTYHAGHHNIKEYLLFEPRLEPGISQDILDELEAQDIRLIHLTLDDDPWGSGDSLRTYGFDFVGGDYTDDGRCSLTAGRLLTAARAAVLT
jgi:hypothetical protein